MKSIILDKQSVIPSKVVCVGRNYVEHIQELNNEVPTSMVIFMKPNSSITDTLTVFPHTLHYEGEICFAVKNGKLSAVGFGLDLTNRTLQNELKGKGLPWERAKAFDGAAVLSEFVSISEKEINTLSMHLYINDVLVQEGTIDLMIHKPASILAEIQTFATFEDNDVIMTGTPKGVSTYEKGDKFVGKIFIDGKEVISQEWIAK